MMCFMSRGGFWVLVRSVDNDMNVVVIYIISNVLQSMISLSRHSTIRGHHSMGSNVLLFLHCRT
jgi:hypothetical protein